MKRFPNRSLRGEFLELIRRAACELPDDVLGAIALWRDREEPGSTARSALDAVIENCALAKGSSRPLCQDTGTNIWYVYHPGSIGEAALARDIIAATRRATELSYLRPNAVDPITGRNSGDNTGRGAPVIHFAEWRRDAVAADVLLKGGGCENVSAQFSLPDSALGAGRDLDGIRRAVIEAVYRAQGKGCSPGIIGVGVGGDRATGMIEAKEQLFRLLSDRNPDQKLADLEQRLFDECNELSIGPMGFGGRATVLGVKIGWRCRVPASFFVSVAYMCWACRRAGVVIGPKGATYSQVSQIARRYERA